MLEENKQNKKCGFTLAEVLITLGIIGVVAAMTIPTLMNQTNNKETITGLKKVYAELLQATELIKMDNGDINTWIPDVGTPGDADLTNIYADKMKTIRNCTTAGVIDCWGPQYKYLKGTTYSYIDNTYKASLILASGSSLIFNTLGKSGNTTYGNSGTEADKVYGVIWVDLNGPKKPNTIGQDVFSFFITKNTLTPYGAPSIKAGGGFDVATCRKDNSGHGCAAWVLYNENMDYLNCITGSEPVCSTIHW